MQKKNGWLALAVATFGAFLGLLFAGCLNFFPLQTFAVWGAGIPIVFLLLRKEERMGDRVVIALFWPIIVFSFIIISAEEI